MKNIFVVMICILFVACKATNGTQPMEVVKDKRSVAYFPETNIPEDSLGSRPYSLEEFRAFVKGKSYVNSALYECYDHEGVRNYVHPFPNHPMSKDKINLLSLAMGESGYKCTFNDSIVNIDFDYDYDPSIAGRYSKRYRFDADTQLLYGTDLHCRFGSKVIVPRLLYIDDTYIILRFEAKYNEEGFSNSAQVEAEYSVIVLKHL